jgi:hypothetical protein
MSCRSCDENRRQKRAGLSSVSRSGSKTLGTVVWKPSNVVLGVGVCPVGDLLVEDFEVEVESSVGLLGVP